MTEQADLAPKLFKPVRTENNLTELYVDGPDCLAMLLREIRNAQHFIHVQVMLFYSDEAGFRVAKALAEKAREGVTVRIMSDSDMSSIVVTLEKYRSSGTSDFSQLKDMLLEAGVKFIPSDREAYWLLNWDDKRAELQEKGVPEEFLVMQDAIQREVDLNMNVLDHRKVIIFDGVSAVVTSMNIGNKYLYEQHPADGDSSGEKWHDGALLIKGPCVSALNKHFASKWMVRGGDIFDFNRHYRSSESYGTDTCTLYSFFPGMKENSIRDYYLRKVKECRGQFIIENPYINDDLFWKELSALDEAQARKIIIINPYKANGNDYKQNASTIQCNMWEPYHKGVTFYSYSSRMTHWKVSLDVVASEVFIGSYNLNHRSALHDFELNILVKSQQLSEKVMEMLQHDISLSSQLTDDSELFQHPDRHPSCLLLRATQYFE